MNQFSYRARTSDGQKASGRVEAISIQQAADLLHGRKLVIVSLKPAGPSIVSGARHLFQSVKLDDLVAFTRQMSTMVAAGLPLTDALHILQGQSNSAFGAIVTQVLTDVQGGSSLASALAKHPRTFPQIYIALVKAGESAGVLDNILSRLADNLEKQKAFVNKVKGAMIYPAIVVTAMVVVSAVMMIFVIPKLTAMYQNLNAELPAMTKVLMAVSGFVAKYWYLLLLSLGGAGFGFVTWYQTAIGREQVEIFLFRLPIIGRLRKFIVLTEFTRTLSLLISAGIAIIEALKITADAVGNPIYRGALLEAAVQVERGLPLAVPIAQNQYFPAILSQMISVGEETGKVDEVLLRLSSYFETESEQGVAALTAAIEPLIMIVLGIGVGFLVISIIMPIYNLTNAL